MGQPEQRHVKNPLILLIYTRGLRGADGRPTLKPRDAYTPLADYFDLSAEERALKVRPDKGSKWENTVQWARMLLVNEELLDKGPRGQWKLTTAGEQRARDVEADYSTRPRCEHLGLTARVP